MSYELPTPQRVAPLSVSRSDRPANRAFSREQQDAIAVLPVEGIVVVREPFEDIAQHGHGAAKRSRHRLGHARSRLHLHTAQWTFSRAQRVELRREPGLVRRRLRIE